MRLRRLHPDRADLTVDEAIRGLRLGDRAPASRPYLALNMIASVDGRAAVGGGTRAISSPVDRSLLVHLRTQVDAVMVGAGTLRAEPYGRLVRDPALRAKRRHEGLAPDPLACLVSGRLDLPADLPLLADPDSRVLIATLAPDTIAGARARVDYVRGAGERLDLQAVLSGLRSQRGVRSVLCEGGPQLNAGLFALGVVDELFLTLAATVAGGAEGSAIVAEAPLPASLDLELVWALEAAGDLFLRYRARP